MGEGVAVRDRFEDAGEMVDLGVAILDFSRDGLGAELAGIANPLNLLDSFPDSIKNLTGSFLETNGDHVLTLFVLRLLCRPHSFRKQYDPENMTELLPIGGSLSSRRLF
jgi:hypothetical protein